MWSPWRKPVGRCRKISSGAPARRFGSPGCNPTTTTTPQAQTQCDVSAAHFVWLLRLSTAISFPLIVLLFCRVAVLSTICPNARSHCWPNGEGHVGVSYTAIRSTTARRTTSKLVCGQGRCPAQPHRFVHGGSPALFLLPHTVVSACLFGRLFPHQAPGWSLEKSQMFVGLYTSGNPV